MDMNARSRNRFLFWALGLSLVIHFIAAAVMHTMPQVSAAPEQRPMHVRFIHVATPPPTPPPTPTPQPQRPTHAAAPSHALANVTHATPPKVRGSSNDRGPVIPLPAATTGALQGNGADLTGTPAPSPRPACSQPFAEAHTIDAVTPNTPEDAAGIEATAQVQVTLDAFGRVTDTRIYLSTSNLRLDRAALLAARQSTYAPAIANCLPIGGTYLFRVDFQS
jgi:TonB family protein